MTTELILFILLAVIAIASAVAMLLTRNAVYSALFLILNFSTIAVFYLLLSAPFIAMAQITVYAGAIMVLFLFVIMLLGTQETGKSSTFSWQVPLAVFLGVMLLGSTGYIIVTGSGITPPPELSVPGGLGNPQDIGLDLFTNYLLPFEATSIILLVAMIGAIVLTQVERRKASIARPKTLEQEQLLAHVMQEEPELPTESVGVRE